MPLASVYSAAPYHVLSWGTLTGMTLFHSFIAGPVQFKTLPRQQFGNLQSKTFPIFFALQGALSGICLLTAPASAGSLFGYATTENKLLWSILLSGFANGALVGPWVTKIMFDKHKLEKSGGNIDEAKMTKLKKMLGLAHAASVGINFIAVGGAIAYAFCLAGRMIAI
ncbi:hypothetical protein SAICODRAFT_27205 [Saitoella complicata NRRL Y-17804]|nr:uncharacterized protein SAICODRAFT_27205 [Saitoella complicata NRRL Y-17804]ODQ50835.1 hypothetical protein SAICODRAFT_27205 [Saitoella complicata NRRL Y-17804]